MGYIEVTQGGGGHKQLVALDVALDFRYFFIPASGLICGPQEGDFSARTHSPRCSAAGPGPRGQRVDVVLEKGEIFGLDGDLELLLLHYPVQPHAFNLSVLAGTQFIVPSWIISDPSRWLSLIHI